MLLFPLLPLPQPKETKSTPDTTTRTAVLPKRETFIIAP
jgi:hypothetical protein